MADAPNHLPRFPRHIAPELRSTRRKRPSPTVRQQKRVTCAIDILELLVYALNMTDRKPDMHNLQVALAEEDYIEVKSFANARSFTLASIVRMVVHLWAEERRSERADMAQDAPKTRSK